MEMRRYLTRMFAGCCLFASAVHAVPVPLSAAPERLQHLLPGEAPPVPREPEKYRQYIEARPLHTKPQLQAPTGSQAAPKAESDLGTLSVNTITPLCPVLSTDTIYTLTGTATGGSYCYGFQITARSKTTAFLNGQDTSTNFGLTLIRHEDDDTLTVLGTSDQPGNADEGLIALTQPGLYYWLMTANASDGSALNFGALTNTSADANELNDSMALATTVTDHQVKSGNMDSASDVDYFEFTAQNGQDVVLELGNSYGSNEWIFEYYNGSSWAALSVNTYYTLSGLAAPSTVYVRVRPNPSATLNPAHTYQLLMGSQAESSVDHVFTNENLVRINVNPYLTTQVHNLLEWTLTVLDSNGNPIQGAEVHFNYQYVNEATAHVVSALSNASGVAGGEINLGNCTGNFSVTETDFGQTWLTYYDVGAWSISVVGSDQAGVGGPNFPAVTLGHICSQTFLP